MELDNRELVTSVDEMAAMDEAAVYMSLALDGALDATNQARFDELLTRYPGVQIEWQAWQALDMDFRRTPAALPAPDFVAKFEHRLLVQERRRKLWLGSAVALLFTGTLAGAIAVALAFVSAVMFSQPELPGGGVRAVATFWSAIVNWVDALLTTLGVLLGTPQALGFGVAYLMLAAVILYAWTGFLRRTTRIEETAQSA